MKTRNSMRNATLAALVATAVLVGCGSDKPEALVASAKDYLAKNDSKAAVIQLKNALQKNPDLAEARFLLGKALLESGETAAAEKELRKALELKYPADQVVPPLARSLMQLGEYKKVIEQFAKTDVATPDGKADLQAAIGDAQLALGKLDEARAAYAAALAARPDHSNALLGEARIKAGTGDLPGAAALVDKAVSTSPKLVEAWQLKGDLALAQGQSDQALAAYRKALDAKPAYLPAHAAIVTLLLRDGKTEEAGKQLDALKKLAPKHPQTLYLQALVAYRSQNFAAGREAIQLQLATAPDNLPGLLLAGAIDFELKAYPQAEGNLLRVLQRAPGQPFARRLLLATYLRSGQPAKALEAAKPVLGKIDNDAGMLGIVGEAYLQSGNPTEAARYFEKANALDPSNTRTRTALAVSHMATGSADQGMRELEDVAATDTGTRADLVLIATTLRKHEFDKALTAIAALEKKQPDSPIAHNLRGVALLGKRDVAGARKSFERALALDPGYLPAATSLARLDLADKKPDDAKKRFDGVLAKDPKNTGALLALAALRAQGGGTTEEVAALIGKAVTAKPAEAGPRLALIAHYLRSKDPKKAVAAAQEAAAAMPDRPDVLDALGRAQQAAGETNQAVATFGKLAKLQPESPLPLLRMANAQAAAKDRDGAMQSLRRALAIKPDLFAAQRGIAALDLEAGHVQQAVTVARDVQKQRPKDAAGYVLEGDIHASRKAWPEAVAAYRAGVKQAVTTELAVKLTAALGAAGQTAEADKFAAAWLKDHPKDTGYRLYLAERALARKEFATALQHYRTLLDAAPDNPALLNNVAWVSGQLKDPKALEYAEKANRLAPDQPVFMDTLGVLLIDKGDTTRGVELLRKASTLAPQAAVIRLNLAKALIKAGQKDAAKKELETLAALGDKFAAQAEVAQLMKGL